MGDVAATTEPRDSRSGKPLSWRVIGGGIAAVLAIVCVLAWPYVRQWRTLADVTRAGGRYGVGGGGPKWHREWLPESWFPAFDEVHSLTIRNLADGDAAIGGVRNLNRLVVVFAQGTVVTDDGLSQLAESNELYWLSLRGRGIRIGDDGLRQIASLPILRFLELEDVMITDAALRALPSARGLYVLNLKDCGIGDEGMESIAKCPSLGCVNLAGTKVTDRGLLFLRGNLGLKELNLAGTEITDAGVGTLADCPHLTHVDLSNTRVTDSSLRYLGRLKELQVLILDGTRITGEGFRHFGESRNLVRLSLAGSKISDEGSEHIKRIPGRVFLNLATPE